MEGGLTEGEGSNPQPGSKERRVRGRRSGTIGGDPLGLYISRGGGGG